MHPLLRGMPIAGFGAHRVLCIGLLGRCFLFPPVKNFRCRSPGKNRWAPSKRLSSVRGDERYDDECRGSHARAIIIGTGVGMHPSATSGWDFPSTRPDAPDASWSSEKADDVGDEQENVGRTTPELDPSTLISARVRDTGTCHVCGDA